MGMTMATDEERLSALVDGELDPWDAGRLISRLHDAPELRAQWGRYHLMGDVLRKNVTGGVPVDLAARVSAALEQEPTVLAPPRSRRAHELGKRAIGFALAASVSAVAILAIQHPGGEELPLVTPLAEAPAPVAPVVPFRVGTVVADSEESRPDPRLGPYIVNHNEYSAASGMHGMIPYARLVSQESGR